VTDLAPIILATDLLNSWVRSKSFHYNYASPRRAIYAYKNQVIESAERAGLYAEPATCFRIKVTCRDCGGSGQYEDWSGYRHDRLCT
jgi:hypothetical protein